MKHYTQHTLLGRGSSRRRRRGVCGVGSWQTVASVCSWASAGAGSCSCCASCWPVAAALRRGSRGQALFILGTWTDLGALLLAAGRLAQGA
eukprot:scaffold13524_cov109-Isochrysis_galbana.AAC.12